MSMYAISIWFIFKSRSHWHCLGHLIYIILLTIPDSSYSHQHVLRLCLQTEVVPSDILNWTWAFLEKVGFGAVWVGGGHMCMVCILVCGVCKPYVCVQMCVCV